jgi:dienelactone hydrolase
MWNKSGVEFAAYISFYPDCMTTFVSDTEVTDRPIRIFGCTPDDYNPIATCKAYVERLRSAGGDVELTEYPTAPHAFDNPLGAIPATVSAKSETVRNCRIEERTNGLLINRDTELPFTYEDACVVHGPHVGYDSVAAEAARLAIRKFLKSALKIDTPGDSN